MKLKIEAFRGANSATELTFDHHRDLTILYGENGSGKTTISDALEFVFHGGAGSLEEKSLDGKTKLPALVHAQRKASDLRVVFENGIHRMTAQLRGGKADIEGDLAGLRLRTLRRNLISKLIEETPSLRFQRIRDFVELPALEREERQLDDFLKQLTESRKSFEQRASTAQQELSSLHEEIFAGQESPPAPASWVETVIAKPETDLLASIGILKDLDHLMSRLRSDYKILGDTFTAIHDVVKTHEDEIHKLKTLARSQAVGMADAIDLLEEAQKFLTARSVETCPVCDTPKGSEILRAMVSGKLESLRSIASQNRKVKDAKKEWERHLASLEARQTDFYGIITQLHSMHDTVKEQQTWQVPPLVPCLKLPSEGKDLTAEWFTTFRSEASGLKPLGEWIAAQLAHLQRSQSLKETLARLVRVQQTAKSECDRIAKMLDLASSIREIFRSERTDYADVTLSSISKDFAAIYGKIHPGEDIEQIRLYVHPDRKGSAMLTGDFHGRTEASPVAYLSESHLDTLGLCLFLALEKKNGAADTLLFLDDAIGSVDEAHLSRLYETILEEASHFRHVLITSHYQPLKFKWKWGQLTKQNVDFIELGTWSVESGLSLHRGCASEINLLKKRLADQDDPAGIAGKAGIVLEYLFDFLTGIYRCRMPRSPGPEQRWTLADYKSGLESDKKKLLKALTSEHRDEKGTVVQTIPLAPILESLFTQLELRNCLGAHYKELAGQFNDLTEATKLGRTTCELLDALCDSDLQLPESNASGSYWANRGTKKTRRLHPLVFPQ